MGEVHREAQLEGVAGCQGGGGRADRSAGVARGGREGALEADGGRSGIAFETNGIENKHKQTKQTNNSKQKNMHRKAKQTKQTKT